MNHPQAPQVGGRFPQPPGGPYQPPYGQRPPKKGMSGCLMALLIAGGLVLVGGLAGGIWVYIEFGEFLGAAGDATKIVLKAQKAPGTKELREKGCSEAMALDVAEFSKVAQRFEDEIAKREGRKRNKVELDAGAAYFVQCKIGITGDKLSCAQVAKTFIHAVSPDGNIIVSVDGLGACSQSFDKDGKLLGEANTPNLQR